MCCQLAVMKAIMKLNYHLVRTDRKTIAIQIKPDGEVIIRAPKRMPMATIEAFVQSKTHWIEKQLSALPAMEKMTAAQHRTLIAQAKRLLPQKVAHFAHRIGVEYGRISIRSQHTRWGSCSTKGNLNFNCLLMLAPPTVVDYVVVHELCHRKQMNHSAAFWAEVEAVLPDYRQSKKWLKENGPSLIGRL